VETGPKTTVRRDDGRVWAGHVVSHRLLGEWSSSMLDMVTTARQTHGRLSRPFPRFLVFTIQTNWSQSIAVDIQPRHVVRKLSRHNNRLVDGIRDRIHLYS
jgi:hypothetical protein